MVVKYSVNSGVIEINGKVFMTPQASVKSAGPVTGFVSPQRLIIEGVLPENFKTVEEAGALTIEGASVNFEGKTIIEKLNVEVEKLSGYSKPLILYIGGEKKLEIRVNNKYVFHTLEASFSIEKAQYVLNLLAAPIKMVWIYVVEGNIVLTSNVLKTTIIVI
ncbi:MAG: hypothetical protein ACO2OS_03810 [Thermosphaera aggregans]|jgi:hypothetical protein|uniref:hypothetical protein n=1 Tax=Thermosphaera aggregans TaxID=54254 RepID=UPI003C101174